MSRKISSAGCMHRSCTQWGAGDVAYVPATDDYKRMKAVPVALVSREVGHMGGFNKENYVEYSKPGIAWLDWQLKGKVANKSRLVGADCLFCKRPGWTAMAKGF